MRGPGDQHTADSGNQSYGRVVFRQIVAGGCAGLVVLH